MAGETVLPDKPRPSIPTKEKGFPQADEHRRVDRHISPTEKLVSNIKTQYDRTNPHDSLQKIREIGEETKSSSIPTDEDAHGISASEARAQYGKNNPRAALESFAAMAREDQERIHEDIDPEIIGRFTQGKLKRKDPQWAVIESAILARIIDVRPEFSSLKRNKRESLAKKWMSDTESRYVLVDLLVGNLQAHEAVRYLRGIDDAKKAQDEARRKEIFDQYKLDIANRQQSKAA